ncbi:TetR/AcrR family transcriptional regulator [Agromyces endophyticus]|uniref:TetR/AcrR family transcriptional regulator n=1 Tax=Agromyces sp. H17E-10 TaxID=2932244 RepID=UPI001FD1EA12|nr:TetR/AcrR family transcriptional regulator [Agromyces sp. H17E-10]UOQ90307.1 TetR/AcrR family transcriptional regulator [Agromyces sp. H17E-10]
MTERAYHHGNLRQALLERAWSTIDDEGLDALSMRQLARDVGVSHGASARHFADRTALLDAVAITGFERMNTALAEAVAAEPTFAGGLRSAGFAYIGFAVEHPAILDLMYKAKHHPEASVELVDLGRASMAAVVALVAEGQQRGEIRPGDVERQALVVFAAVHGVAALATDDLLDGVDWRVAADATLEAVLGALAVAGASGEQHEASAVR